jgi:DnaK suppressor protein
MKPCEHLEPRPSHTEPRASRAERVRWSERRAKSVRSKLLAKRQELGKELAESLGATRTPKDDGFADLADLAAKCVEMAAASERDRVLSDTVVEIDRALQTLSDGTYGTCDVCGARIPLARLRAIPWATRCVACQERRELEHPSLTERPSLRVAIASVPGRAGTRERDRAPASSSVRATRAG